MSVRADKRQAAVDRLADHILAHGLAGSSLRALAAAAGTSDRMLLYYFDSKDDLLAAALARVAERMSGMLEAAMPEGGRAAFAPLLKAVWEALGSPALRPYMRLWLELATASARGEEPHRQIGGAIVDGFLAWANDHLDTADDDARRDEAALFLATIDGMLLLDAVGRGGAAAAAVRGAAG